MTECKCKGCNAILKKESILLLIQSINSMCMQHMVNWGEVKKQIEDAGLEYNENYKAKCTCNCKEKNV